MGDGMSDGVSSLLEQCLPCEAQLVQYYPPCIEPECLPTCCKCPTLIFLPQNSLSLSVPWRQNYRGGSIA